MKITLVFLLANLMFCAAEAFLFRCGSGAGLVNCNTDMDVFCCNPSFTACAECCMDTPHCPPPSDLTRVNQIYCVDQLCVECRNDRDCSIPTPMCDAGTCVVECADDAACLMPNQVCDVANGICVCSTDMDRCNGFQEVCDADGNCACNTGFVRDTFDRCVADCDPPCPPNRTCARDGTCICAPGFAESANGGCDPCIADCVQACHADQVCTNGVCICAPGTVNVLGDCIPCTAECQNDSDCNNADEICNALNQCVCTTGDKLAPGQCVPPGKLGGACLNGKCKGKRVRCNTTTNMCECRHNCEETTVCKRNS